MAKAIAHRGPDASGCWAEPHVGLAHRRLSIIDLAGGDQPMTNEDGTIHVVFNGELYNYRQLRDQLIDRGHVFQSESDTEVLVHLYEEHGERLVDHLRGMFALALWDSRKKRLFLARDRVGQKPLYIYRDDGRLAFGSEIKAILALEGIDRQLDPQAIDAYFTYGCVPESLGIFARVRKLPPACTMTVSPDCLEFNPRRYWSLDLSPEHDRSLDQWKEAISAKFDETIAAHRIADVPVGAFLSGGLDSSLIVSAMAAEAPPQTFSIGFEETRFSELPQARLIANHFGTHHTEHIVTPNAVQSLEDLVHYYDEPFADSSAIPSLAVARLAAEHVKVVLSGDGGDEAFGGYSRYPHDLREARWRRRIPASLRRGLCRPLGAVWPKADRLPRPLRLKTALQNLALEPPEAYANTLAISRRAGRAALFQPELLRMVDHRPSEDLAAALYQAPKDDPLRGMIGVDVGLLLPDDFLTKVDRASMAFGLEVRPPFVDHELLELCARVPSEYKVRNGETKWILKQALGNRLPPAILNGPKRGFEIPIDGWLRGPLRDTFGDLVLEKNSPLSPIINRRAAHRLYRNHQRGHGRHGPQLWSLMVLARWITAYCPTGVRL